MQVPTLAENRHHGRFRLHQCQHVAILVDGVFSKPCGAERGQPRMLELQLLGAQKEVLVFWIRSRPAALNVVNPQLVQFLGNQELVLH